jgi:uncharacterized protein YrrD
MKSGNNFKVGMVKDVTVDYSGDTITGLNIQSRWYRRLPLARCFTNSLYMQSINLSQIEAITYN